MNDMITVRLPDGYKIYISKHAKKRGLRISDVVREALRVFFKL